MADDGIAFDGDALDHGPLGGAETAFISLAEAFAARGHRVQVFNRCSRTMSQNGVLWKPIEGGLPDTADLYIANRGDKLLPLMPFATARVFWIHNPADYLKKWRYVSKLWYTRPTVVFSSNFHVRSFSRWIPVGGKATIPYGISKPFIDINPPRKPPAPRAVFTSSPLRSLDWLLKTWATKIWPHVQEAELHVFSGPETYGEHGKARFDKMEEILSQARHLSGKGVVLRTPLPKASLAVELAGFRSLLYRGDPGETFCLAVGEAQAAGVPSVVQDIGCVAERVMDKVTGFVTHDDLTFAARSRALLVDDDLWSRQQEAALKYQRKWGWADAAAAFEQFLSP